MVGTTISHYSILEKLGEGGMGVVYKARDTELGRLVAVKVLRTSTEASDDDRKRLLQEARATSVLSHPNIITVYEIGHASQIDFIVMEYVNGMSLERLLVDRGLPLERAVSFATQLASALAAAHGAGIVHRDIKPANILVTSEGQVKVLDFGLAKATGRPLLTETESTLTVAPETRNGLLVGTIRYMSPEQAQGQRVDAKTDIFS